MTEHKNKWRLLSAHQPSEQVMVMASYPSPAKSPNVIMRSKEIWGPDATEFRPERWENVTNRQKNAFIPFSHGPRACVGRNVAEMEMKMIAASWARRYDVQLRQDIMETREGFLRKPLALEIGLKRRTSAK